MISEIVQFIIAFMLLLFASITDIKTKEVPDKISYSLILFGIVFNLVLSIIYSTFIPILLSLYGGILFFVLGYILYRFNLWGGADTKILAGMGFLFGFFHTFLFQQFMVAFLINLCIIGSIFGLAHLIYYGVKHKIRPKLLDHKAKIILYTLLLIIIFNLFTTQLELRILFTIVAILIPLFVMLFNYISEIQKLVMIKKRKIEELTEGDWVAKDVKVGKKIIAKTTDNGLSLKQLKELNELFLKGKIKTVLVKEGIPFIPSFFISLIITHFFGNLLFLLI